MKALVTGGAGFIGSHLVERLISLNDQVIILDDFSAGVDDNLSDLRGKGVEVVKGTLADRGIVNYCIKDVDKVFHLGAKTNIDESLLFPHLFDEVNSRGTLNVLVAAKDRKIPVLQMSTSEVYGSALRVPIDEDHPLNPQSPYAASKVAAERYCYSFVSSFGSPIIVIRSFNNYGPRQKGNAQYGGLITRNVIRVLCNMRPVIRGGSQTRDYLFVKDTVEGLIAASKQTSCYGKVLNLGTGVDYTAREIVNMILDIRGSDLKPEYEDARAGDVQRLICDSKRAYDILGWKPRYDLRKGLEETLNWYESNLDRYRTYVFPSFKQTL